MSSNSAGAIGPGTVISSGTTPYPTVTFHPPFEDAVGGIEFEIHEDIVRQALEEYFNNHLFKEPQKVQHFGRAVNAYGYMSPETYKVRCQGLLSRLAGEESK